MDVNQLFEPAFIALLDTPGTYTLEDIENAENLTSPYLNVPPFNSGGLGGIISVGFCWLVYHFIFNECYNYGYH